MTEKDRHEGLGRRQRLRRRSCFLAVEAQGRRLAGKSMVIYFLARPPGEGGAFSRLGITVGRKVGGAVLRNRVKRWVREAYRRMADELPPASDYVVIARSAAAAAGYQRLAAEIRDLLMHAGKT